MLIAHILQPVQKLSRLIRVCKHTRRTFILCCVVARAHTLNISKYFTSRLAYRINMDMQAVRIAKEANVQDTIHTHTYTHARVCAHCATAP